MLKIFLYLFSLFFYINIFNQSSVTYTLNGGRFGDQILAYMHAKWVSYKHEVPVLYKNFLFSDQLMLHDLEPHFSLINTNTFKYVKTLNRGQILDINRNDNTLHVIPYFPECLQEYDNPQLMNQFNWPYFAVGWDDREFKQLLNEFIKPKSKLNLIEPKKNKISVAIHVRKNSNGYDLPLSYDLQNGANTPSNVPWVDTIFPLKHVPDIYYIDQIKKINELFEGRPLYVFIFTDDIHAKEITEKYKNAINCPNIEWACRQAGNNHYTNILEDFFSMTLFECFIRADSNLSIAASKLGDYAICITPEHHYFDNGHLVVDKVSIKIDQDIFDKVINKKLEN